jgi:hypothetical protein
MITQNKQLKPAASITPFLARWHRQHRWRMEQPITRRMQQNTHRWYCLFMRKRRNTLLSWARSERAGYVSCIEARDRFPSNNDLPRSFVFWHVANVYARVGMGEEKGLVLHEEEAALLIRIRAYNDAQERTWTHTWHGAGGYYGEDEVRTKMLHAKQRMATLGL